MFLRIIMEKYYSFYKIDTKLIDKDKLEIIRPLLNKFEPPYVQFENVDLLNETNVPLENIIQ